ncbi:hypothetical protein Mapa_012490 [Marchantia paleacea]|nr:hypothetical protein Mapa_012490 [Marchantia paleacea]
MKNWVDCSLTSRPEGFRSDDAFICTRFSSTSWAQLDALHQSEITASSEWLSCCACISKDSEALDDRRGLHEFIIKL